MKHLWRKFYDSKGSDLILTIVIVITLASTICGTIAMKRRAARKQAVTRAQKMDGRIFTIPNVAYNWIGDTKLLLQDEHGKDVGWVMIQLNNPLTNSVNPITLAFTKPHNPLPFPMKVKAHFRNDPWQDHYDHETHENYTGSFIEFEEVQ